MQQIHLRATFLAFSAVVAGALCFAPTAAAQAKKSDKDTVQLKGGKAEAGKIQSEEYAGVALEIKPGQTKTIPWTDVAGIDYANAGAFPDAIEALNSGKLDEALTQLNGLKSGGKLRPPLQQQVQYNLGLVLQRLGKFEEAAAAYKELFETFPKGRYLRMAGENWVTSMLAKDNVNGAEDALSKITLAAQGLQGADFDINMIKGRVLEAKKSFADARNAYDAAAKAAPANSTAAQEAQLGKARCLVGEGKKGDADPILQELKKTGTSNVVLAGAWNTLGEVATEEGRSKRNSEMLIDALYMHLRGIVQYLPLPGEPTNEYERALFDAAQVCKSISELETNAERKKLYKDRSETNLATLKKAFPNSLYLKHP
jgi:tetratricopeptide (TPR) repeat protein